MEPQLMLLSKHISSILLHINQDKRRKFLKDILYFSNFIADHFYTNLVSVKPWHGFNKRLLEVCLLQCLQTIRTLTSQKLFVYKVDFMVENLTTNNVSQCVTLLLSFKEGNVLGLPRIYLKVFMLIIF